MSNLALKLDVIREASILASKLSPAMARAMTAPDATSGQVRPEAYVVANEREVGELTLYAPTRTSVALMSRGLIGNGKYSPSGRIGHDLTTLGLLVRDVLVRGVETLLKEARAEEGQDEVDPAKVAHTLTPVMREVMSEIDKAGFIVGRRDTLRALARRGLCGHPRYDYAEVTDLGRAVHVVLIQPVEAEEQPATSTPVDAKPASLWDGTERTVEAHIVLARVAAHQYGEDMYRAKDGSPNVFQPAAQGERQMLKVAERLGWIRLDSPVKGLGARLTDAGCLVLVTWDRCHGREDFPNVPVANVGVFSHPLAEGVPSSEMLRDMVLPTKAIVQRFPEYFITGPGRYLAQAASCEHGYRLTDSCPLC